ncbi:tRNA (guanosine(37)-N1)-methyltransferase TrmD [Arsenicicoccus bolidensis]|uniref:tRNA (guanine-N(1)-)-methyltransferase n=1 Tax=Arsenicicoccus bolidensis TaxID=229480 RepID=A0ABS9PZY7_9MICO|nr:tRNA (guanosine(37)-N1)-methyltransferase TrmD [Arsenicicoccus bolidensis]MCG7321194.1 tRNA (guanosine(37)-N1)-methyltransferase TrmD [Arsenicicoccus bolidensis]
MRIDVVSIFPEYLSPLDLSLIGKARREGLLDLHVHDLRSWTTDRHRTVDDTPYGGGAGMVMKPEPWAQAIDHLRSVGDESYAGARPLLVVPGPGGRRFDQAMAHELAGEPWLAFACGRYEGIDERVYEHAQEALDGRVRVVSLGDYVLNGGEVAVLTITEAVARLLPGVVGNAASLVEESHEDGLLEYPVYTKPASWRGREVPPVLLSGDHGAIATWRHRQRLERTAARRPDLLPSSATLAGGKELPIRLATPADVPELWTLTRACWVDEGRVNEAPDIPPLVETLAQARSGIDGWRTWVVRDGGRGANRGDGRLVASVRGRLVDGNTWEVGRLMVAPDLVGQGMGRQLLAHVERQAPPEATRAWLLTGARSERNQRLYRKAGYRPVREARQGIPGTVELEKRLRRS